MDENKENINQKDQEDLTLTTRESEVVTDNIPPLSSNEENINQKDQKDVQLTTGGPEVVSNNISPLPSNDDHSSTIFVTKKLDSKMQLSSTSILSSPPSSRRTVMAPTDSRRSVLSQIQMDESIQKSTNSMIDGPNQQRISSLDLLGKVESSMRNLNTTADNQGDSQFASSSTLQQYSNVSNSTAAANKKTSGAAIIVENDEEDGEVEPILSANVQPDRFHVEIPHAYLVTEDENKKNSFIDLWNSCWNRIKPSSNDRINDWKSKCSKQQLMIFCGIILLICVLLGSILGSTGSAESQETMTGSNADQRGNIGNIEGRWDLILELKTDSVDAKFAASVAMHAKGNKVLVGEPGNSAFKLFEFGGKDQAYSSKGKFLDSGTMGECVALSENGHVLAGGGRYYNDNGQGTVYVAEIHDNYNRGEITRVDWKVGDADYDHYGSSIALSHDGEYLGVGADQETCPTCSGYVITYKWGGDRKKYEQRGAILRGKKTGDMFGSTIAMTTDGNTLAIGSSHGNYVQVYKWERNKWEQKGTDITPPPTTSITEKDQFGFDIALSSSEDDDENRMTLVISNPYLGNTYIYQFENTDNDWIDSGIVLKNGGNFVDINHDGTFAVIADSSSVLLLEKITKLNRWFQRGTLQITNNIQSISLSQNGNNLSIGSTTKENKGRVSIYQWIPDSN